jgi:hypothetical protein
MPEVRYKHAEAFCLMTYRSDDGTESEVLWNSRDGVTPFVITLLSGKTAMHVDWNRDQRVLDYVPPAGSRIFVDLTLERAREQAERNLARWAEEGTFADLTPPSAEELALEYLHPGAPDIIEVPE